MPRRKPGRQPTGAMAHVEEPEVRIDDTMPKGYRFVPKGNVYITKHCRKKTHEAGRTLYVVFDDRDKPIGLRCPTYIYGVVMSENRATATQRAEAVQKRDAAIEDSFRDAIVKLFPEIPKREVPQILKHSLKKHSRRVGRTNTVALQDRVKLAVRAYIRHIHTDYDQLLKQGASRQVARKEVWERLNEVARQWGGRPLKPAAMVAVKERQVEKSKTAMPPKRKTKTDGAAKKAAILIARATTRRMSREASELSSPAPGAVHQLELDGMGFRARTRRAMKESVLSEIEDIVTMEKLDVDVGTVAENTDARDVVFIRDEDMDGYDSGGSEWSN